MAKMVTLFGLLFTLCVAFSQANIVSFVGGSFYQAGGVYSPNFAVYNPNSDNPALSAWARDESSAENFDGAIMGLYPVGEGVFAVGAFTTTDGYSTSSSVAYYDGVKWCNIRQGLTGGPATAVWCDSDTSCWVAGQFSSVVNLPSYSDTQVNNFAHYYWDNSTGEWLWDSTVQNWNNNTQNGGTHLNTLASYGGFAIKMMGVRNTTDNNLYFFVLLNTKILVRGSAVDGGWSQVASTLGIVDFGIDETNYPPTLYALTNSASDPSNPQSTISIQNQLLAPCTGPLSSCLIDIIPEGFIDLAFVPTQDNSYFVSYMNIYSRNGTTYLNAMYDIDGTGNQWQPRNYVLMQVGNSNPVPLGGPWSDLLAPGGNRIVSVFIDPQTLRPMVTTTGDNSFTNFWFPPGHSDLAGDDWSSSDSHFQDHLILVGIWSEEKQRWEQALGGGFTDNSNPVFLVYNNNTEQWFVANSNGMQDVYDLNANNAVLISDSEPVLVPVFTRAIWRRATNGQIGMVPANVFEFRCESDCTSVYVGGDFHYHGNQTLGAIALVTVQPQGADAQIQSVGGGLWHNDMNIVRDVPSAQFTAGAVFSLVRTDSYLYAGGSFSRGGNGYVCLNNVARILRNSADAQWEDLNGGCDNEVDDLEVYGDRLYAAGLFQWCGYRQVNYVGAYSYTAANPEWSSLNNGLNNYAYSLTSFAGRLIVGGDFTYAGGIPATGVASWDGSAWSPLLYACTDDCVPGGLNYYFTVLGQPIAAYGLRANGDYLYALVATPDTDTLSDAGGFTDVFLASWTYTDGNNGVWSLKGDQAVFGITSNNVRGDAIGPLVSNTQVNVGAALDLNKNSAPFMAHLGGSLNTFSDDFTVENWVGPYWHFGYGQDSLNTIQQVYVVRSSASSLTSPLAFFLSFF
jgi:hypothetical protein